MSKGRKKRQMSQIKQREWIPPSSSSLFYAGAWIWGPPSLVRVIFLLSLLIQRLMSFRVTFTDTPEMVLFQILGHPLAHSSWHVQLTLTSSKFPWGRNLNTTCSRQDTPSAQKTGPSLLLGTVHLSVSPQKLPLPSLLLLWQSWWSPCQ